MLVEQVSRPKAKRVVLEIAKRCDRLAELVVLGHSVIAAASLSTGAPYRPAGIAASTATEGGHRGRIDGSCSSAAGAERTRALVSQFPDTPLKPIVNAIEAYEARRWPLGKGPAVPHVKG